MPPGPAARAGDPTGHPGTLLPAGAVLTVLIEGLPAAVVGTAHTCAMPPPAGPHPPNAVTAGSATVLIGGRPAARVGDLTACGAPIAMGALSVQIGG